MGVHWFTSEGGRHAICTAARPRRTAAIARNDARLPPGPAATQQGLCYPPDPPTVEEIVAVMRAAGENLDGVRLRGLIVVLWRAGLRISEALALTETDLDPDRGALLVRHDKGDRRREVGMDRWAWDQLSAWLTARATMPVGPVVLHRARSDPR